MLFISPPLSKQATSFLPLKGTTYIFANEINCVDQVHLEEIFPFLFSPLNSNLLPSRPLNLTAPVNQFVFTQNTTKMLKLPCKLQEASKIFFWLLHWWVSTPWYKPWHNGTAGRCSFQDCSFLYRSFGPNNRDAGVWEHGETTTQDLHQITIQQGVKCRTVDTSPMEPILSWV